MQTVTYSPDAEHDLATEAGRAQSNRPPVLVQYWRVVIRWRWIILGILAASLVLGLLATVLATPKYTATSLVEISRQQDRVVNVQDVRQESSNPADQEFYQTQYALLRSRSLAERVVKDLKLADNEAFLTMFHVKSAALLAGNDRGPKSAQQRATLERDAADALIDHVGIDPIRGSSLVVVTFTSPDAALSQRVVNKWTEDFMDMTLARRFEASAYARQFLEGRLSELRARLEESERRLVQYASAQRIITVPGGAGGSSAGDRPIVADDLASINTALAKAVSDRVDAESKLRSSRDGGRSSVALANDAISGLRQRRAEAAAEYARLKVQFEPGYPALNALAQQVQELDRAIAREESRVGASFRTTYDEAVMREATLRGQVEGLKAGVLDLRRRSIQYNIYQREVDTNRQLYDALLQRYKEIGIAGGVGTNNIAVVDPARIPEKPSSPSLPLNLMLALFLGVVVATVTTLALEQIDEAVKDPSDVAEATGLPLLGTIPRVDTASPAELVRDRKSSVSEAYLSLQTNLEFSTNHGFPRSLAVTSTRAAEGKSTSSFAVAQSLARTGRRVVLVDGDMRSPSLHGLFGVENARGVSNFLAGESDLAGMLVATEEGSLSLLLAGPQPPNAAELLTGPRFDTMIKSLLEHFDHIIVDSPPVLGLADAPLIASRVEGVIYAVQAQGARTSTIRAAIMRLKSANANLVGVVLTKFDARKAHYGYGYDYGYDYGTKKASA